MHNIMFQSVTIEHYEKGKKYEQYWSDVHPKYIIILYS